MFCQKFRLVNLSFDFVWLQLVDVNDGYMSLMDDNGETREDLKLPEDDLGKEIQDKFDNDEQVLVSTLDVMSSFPE